jgi:hypothetical protein
VNANFYGDSDITYMGQTPNPNINMYLFDFERGTNTLGFEKPLRKQIRGLERIRYYCRYVIVVKCRSALFHYIFAGIAPNAKFYAYGVITYMGQAGYPKV